LRQLEAGKQPGSASRRPNYRVTKPGYTKYSRTAAGKKQIAEAKERRERAALEQAEQAQQTQQTQQTQQAE